MFDRVVVVDWSANSTPKSGPDSIWIACRERGAPAVPPENVRTRTLAVQRRVDLLDAPGRALVGFDFAFGYPAGFAAAAGLVGTPWAATWRWLADALTDDERNRNNRFEVAAALNERLGRLHFWGTPPARAGAWLTPTRPDWTGDHLSAHRATERVLLAEGTRPFTVWQLLGAGAVGSQSLTGIVALERLRRDPRIGDRVTVWPFETGLCVPDRSDAIVLAEVWPSAVTFDHVDHPVKDARQVQALADALTAAADLDPVALLSPSVPDVEAVCSEEGWVLRPG